MATINDVYNAIGAIVLSTIYPNGTSQPSIINAGVKIIKGWPLNDELNNDLSAGNAQVSIFKLDSYERKTNYLGRLWQNDNIPPATITLTISQNTVTIGGTVTLPQHIAIYTNSNTAYHYNLQVGDTLNSIATNLAAIIPNSLAVGNVVTIANQYNLSGVVGVVGTSQLNTKRQEQGFMISSWANNNAKRDALGDALDEQLSFYDRLTLPDQYAPFRYMKQHEVDLCEKQNVYRRDLYYTCEYQTFFTESFPTITQVQEIYGINS